MEIVFIFVLYENHNIKLLEIVEKDKSQAVLCVTVDIKAYM